MGYFTLQPPQGDERPQRTFYYEKPDGSVFACNEREASGLHKKFKQLGVSDGTLFFRLLQEARTKQNNALVELEMKYPDYDELSPSKKKKWKLERNEIAENAKKALQNALKKEQASGIGKFFEPGNFTGQFVGKFNPQLQKRVSSLIGL